MKKNNKGFSLVELIVVILIMAILGVALTPQVIKWVNNSKISSTITNYNSLVDAAQLATANETVYSALKAATGAEKTVDGVAYQAVITITVADTVTVGKTKTDASAADDAALTAFTDQLKSVSPDYLKAVAKDAGTYTIYVCQNGTVVKASAPTDANIDK